jgi:hypothetical protein
LEQDYVAVGSELAEIGTAEIGTAEIGTAEIRTAEKNLGSEALSAFVFHQASQPDPVDLLGAMFIIENLGTAKAGRWAAMLCWQLGLTGAQTRFLSYHGKHDTDHFVQSWVLLRTGWWTTRGRAGSDSAVRPAHAPAGAGRSAAVVAALALSGGPGGRVVGGRRDPRGQTADSVRGTAFRTHHNRPTVCGGPCAGAWRRSPPARCCATSWWKPTC